jgi:Rha family phage regulatory protein
MVMSNIVVSIVGNELATTSRNVALVFGKEHKNVLAKISGLLPDLPEEFSQLNFKPSEFIDERGKNQPEFILTEDGFVFLVGRFTGKEAAKFSCAYIAEFRRMKEALRNPFGMNSDALNDFIRRCDESVAKGSKHGKGLVTRKAEKKQLSKEKTLILDALQMKLTLELGDK